MMGSKEIISYREEPALPSFLPSKRAVWSSKRFDHELTRRTRPVPGDAEVKIGYVDNFDMNCSK